MAICRPGQPAVGRAGDPELRRLRSAYLLDSAGRETKQVDGRLGTTLLGSGVIDHPGRLANVDGVVDGQPAHLTVKRGSDGTPTALVGMDGGSTGLDLDFVLGGWPPSAIRPAARRA